MSITLKAHPLNAEALAPYVSVLAARDGKARVFPEVHVTGDVPGAHAFTMLCPQPVTGPVSIATMERHPHSNQSFLPIRSGRWLVVVAPTAADGSPDLSRAMAFVASPQDAICIYQNVWHAGLTVLDLPGEFGMIMWKAENGEDGEVATLSEALAIEL